MCGHISKPVSIISLLNVYLKFSLTVPSDNLNTAKSGLALTRSSNFKSATSGRKPWIETVLLEFIWLLSVVHSGFHSNFAKKKSFSNGNELKNAYRWKKWPTVHSKSIYSGLFSWVKSIEHAQITHNHFYPTQKQFFNAILHFLRDIIPEKWKNFRSQVSDNFCIISHQNFQILEWGRYKQFF